MPKLWIEHRKSNKFKEEYDSYWVLKCQTDVIDIKNKEIKCKLEVKTIREDLNKNKLLLKWRPANHEVRSSGLVILV